MAGHHSLAEALASAGFVTHERADGYVESSCEQAVRDNRKHIASFISSPVVSSETPSAISEQPEKRNNRLNFLSRIHAHAISVSRNIDGSFQWYSSSGHGQNRSSERMTKEEIALKFISLLEEMDTEDALQIIPHDCREEIW